MPSAGVERDHNFVVAFHAKGYSENVFVVNTFLRDWRVAIGFDLVRRFDSVNDLSFSDYKLVPGEYLEFLPCMLCEPNGH